MQRYFRARHTGNGQNVRFTYRSCMVVGYVPRELLDQSGYRCEACSPRTLPHGTDRKWAADRIALWKAHKGDASTAYENCVFPIMSGGSMHVLEARAESQLCQTCYTETHFTPENCMCMRPCDTDCRTTGCIPHDLGARYPRDVAQSRACNIPWRISLGRSGAGSEGRSP